MPSPGHPPDTARGLAVTRKPLRARVLKAEAFAPFGRVIEVPARPPDVSRPNLDWWGGLYDLEFSDTDSLGILTIKRCPLELDMMERHLRAAEIFIPIEGVGILVFAPTRRSEAQGETPDLAGAAAFIVDGTQALVIERGVWHNPGFAVTASLRFILAVRKATADDLETVPVEETPIVL